MIGVAFNPANCVFVSNQALNTELVAVKFMDITCQYKPQTLQEKLCRNKNTSSLRRVDNMIYLPYNGHWVNNMIGASPVGGSYDLLARLNDILNKN